MKLDDVLKWIYDTFLVSPEKVFITVLLAWVLASLYFRFIKIGSKISLPKILLDDFSCDIAGKTHIREILEHQIIDKESADVSSEKVTWTVGEIAMACWLFRLTKITLLVSCLALLFLPMGLFVGELGIVKPDVDLDLGVVGTALGFFSLFPLLIFILISIAKTRLAVQQLPIKCIKSAKEYQVILFYY